jgi:hypothetical protein
LQPHCYRFEMLCSRCVTALEAVQPLCNRSVIDLQSLCNRSAIAM